MLLPCLLTNIWQAFVGGYLKQIVKRIWVLLIAVIICTWTTTSLLPGLQSQLLSVLLGIIICLYGFSGFVSPQIVTPEKHEIWVTPVIGVINGIVTGLTGTFVVPGVLYLQSLQMQRDMLIQAMGILFMTSTFALGTGLFTHGLVDSKLFLLSVAALIPSFIGLIIGQLVRKRIPENSFKKIFYIALLMLGGYILIQQIV